MKKNLLLFPVLALLVVACNNDNMSSGDTKNDTVVKKEEVKPLVDEKSVVGKWKVIEVNRDISEQEKKDAIEAASIEFRADGTYTSVDKKETESGTYTYDKDSGTITIKQASEENGIPIQISWKDGNMVMSMGEGNSFTLRRM